MWWSRLWIRSCNDVNLSLKCRLRFSSCRMYSAALNKMVLFEWWMFFNVGINSVISLKPVRIALRRRCSLAMWLARLSSSVSRGWSEISSSSCWCCWSADVVSSSCCCCCCCCSSSSSWAPFCCCYRLVSYLTSIQWLLYYDYHALHLEISLETKALLFQVIIIIFKCGNGDAWSWIKSCVKSTRYKIKAIKGLPSKVSSKSAIVDVPEYSEGTVPLLAILDVLCAGS